MNRVRWIRAEPPLPVIAVAGKGAVGERLAERAATRDSVTIDVASPWTVLRGEDLPWVDGVIYLGALEEGALLVPVLDNPDAPPDLVLAAVRRLASPDSGPFALLPHDTGVDVVVLRS